MSNLLADFFCFELRAKIRGYESVSVTLLLVGVENATVNAAIFTQPPHPL